MNIPTYRSSILQMKAYRTLQVHVNAVLSRFGLNSSQWSILGQIYEQAGLRFADVAALLGVEPALITMMTDPLLGQGYVKKERHPEDKRAKILTITDRGAATIKEIEHVLQKQLKQLLHGTSEKELMTYRKVLETIINNGGAAS